MNNKIQVVGQVISCVNYTSKRLFNFNPGPIQAAAETFLAGGVTELEIPQGVLDPEGRFPETGLDKETLRQTIAGLPAETKVVATYLGPIELGADNDAYLKKQKQVLRDFVEYFPDFSYAMLHPAPKQYGGCDDIRKTVEVYAQLAKYALSLREGLQLCFHNHYDSSGESAEQMRTYLAAIDAFGSPVLRWGPDTGHCHGMGDEYLDVLAEYAHLIGDYFHIKARVPAFDKLHGGDDYRAERDIWSNEAEVGTGLYSGFVNAADPEIQTPFKEIFRIICEKAKPSEGLVRGAMEIDIPRQHPRLEVLCAVLYLKNVHNIEGGLPLSNDDIISRVFA